jgi:hypothetical protein
MEKEVRQEASVPVQTRVSVVSLAELDMYWLREGSMIRSMSQLVAWSLDLLCEVLRANNRMVKDIESVSEAHRYLSNRELYQPSLRDRGRYKMSAALKFENLRYEGDDPARIGEKKRRVYSDYNIVHRKNSVQMFEGRVDSDLVSKATEIFNSLPDGKIGELVTDPGPVRAGMNEKEFKEHMRASEEAAKEENRKLDELLASRKEKIV